MNMITKTLSTVALFILSAVLMVSCKKEDPLGYNKNRNSTIQPSPYTGGTTTTTNTTGTNTLAINWDNRADGTYAYTQSLLDFGNMIYWDAYSTQTSGGMLKTTLAKNVVGTTGGVVAKTTIPNTAAYQLSFDMKFDPNFDFSWGGKVGFGMFIGEGNTGGDPAWDGNG